MVSNKVVGIVTYKGQRNVNGRHDIIRRGCTEILHVKVKTSQFRIFTLTPVQKGCDTGVRGLLTVKRVVGRSRRVGV